MIYELVNNDRIDIFRGIILLSFQSLVVEKFIVCSVGCNYYVIRYCNLITFPLKM